MADSLTAAWFSETSVTLESSRYIYILEHAANQVDGLIIPSLKDPEKNPLARKYSKILKNVIS